VPDPTLYLFDGFNLLYAGAAADTRELRDRLASFVALTGARGVLVFDGTGPDEEIGALSVRWAPDADTLLERLAARHRSSERVLLVSSDFAVRGTSGQEVTKLSSREFARELGELTFGDADHARLAERLDPDTRERLERLRRGGEPPAARVEPAAVRGEPVDVTVAATADGGLEVKLQTSAWEVNVRAPAAEFAKLRAIRDSDWDTGRSIRAGESAGSPVFWAIDGDVVTLMIGLDDESWDVAVTVPVETVAEIVRKARP
jgi:predicted RNA-binding protein with PIN domain